MSVPYSRTLFGFIPWYSFLIVLGAAAAIILAVREEKRTDLKKDTVLDFSLIVLPVGIIGARIYYVIFSWDAFKDDFISVFRIWEGGIAIYGAVIAGLLTAFIFCRRRKIPVLTLCDLIAPGLILAQAIGRWGNYFNQEAYGLLLEDPSLCFFPFAVQIQGPSGLEWHMATFFYEFFWNICVFVFLMVARRKWFRYRGDVFFFYAVLYACGRLIIEDFRMDSLYAASSVRVSQLLSVLICLFIIGYYIRKFRSSDRLRSPVSLAPTALALAADLFAVLWMTGAVVLDVTVAIRFLLLLACSVLNIAAVTVLYVRCREGDVLYADHRG